MVKNIKKLQFEIQLNSIGESNNPTQIPVEFILHDFELSWNNTIIKKETAQKALNTLKNMPIVCKYYKNTNDEDDSKNDALGGHEAHLDINRDGELTISTDTIAIGIFTEDAYIETIKDENGQDKEVVKGRGILWSSRYPDIIGLLVEWWNKGTPVKSSMEILYDEYLYKEGTEEILNYVYEGHCILNSEKRGDHDVVLPAYDVSEISKFERLVAEAIQHEKEDNINKFNKEGLNKMADEKFKKVFELSFDDIRSLIYGQLSAVLSDDEYMDSWITEVYETYFVLSYWNASTHKYFKVNYAKVDEAITIDWENRVEVYLYQEWREIPEVQTSLNELNVKITGLETSLNEKEESIKGLNSTIETLTTEKDTLETQFNDATEKMIGLNSQVEEMRPIVEESNKAKYEKALNEKMDFYKTKFEAVKGIEKFNAEDVQTLVKNSLADEKAILQLNAILTELIQPVKENKDNSITEYGKSMNGLIPTDGKTLSRYIEE